jgi:hypothetical protein
MRLKKKHIRLIEFLVIGVLFGLIEDLIAVKTVSDVSINFRVVLTVLMVAIPFAIVSELIVDHPKFWEYINIFKKEDEEKK